MITGVVLGWLNAEDDDDDDDDDATTVADR